MFVRSVVGTWHQAAGVAGTVTVPGGAFVTQILAQGGTMTIFGGPTITLTANQPAFRFLHDSVVSGGPGKTKDIVFAGTTSYFLEYFTEGNT